MCRWLWRRRTTASSSLSCEGSLRRCRRRPFRISCSAPSSGGLGLFLPYPSSLLPPCCSPSVLPAVPSPALSAVLSPALPAVPCLGAPLYPVCAHRVVPNCLTFTPHKTHTPSNHPKLRHFSECPSHAGGFVPSPPQESLLRKRPSHTAPPPR